MTTKKITPNLIEATLNKASKSAKKLAEAGDIDEAEEHWDHFIHEHAKIYSKIKEHCKGDVAKWQWSGLLHAERKKDPLLQYIHQAQNSDKHNFELIAEDGGFDFRIGSTGAGYIQHLAIFHPDENGVCKVKIKWVAAEEGAEPTVFTSPFSLKLLAVSNYGITYQPPKTHLGDVIDGNDARTVASLALIYIQNKVEELFSKFP